MKIPKKIVVLKEMQYPIGESEDTAFRNAISVFTFPLFGVPVQISGPGFLAIRRFLRFERKATKHARKLTKALNQAAEAARAASIYFYADEIPLNFGEKRPTQEPAAPTD